MTDKKASKGSAEDEIDLLALAKIVWESRRRIFAIVFVLMVLGLAISFLSPKEFTASSTFIPQTSQSNRAGGSLGGLASLAGIDMGNVGGSAEITPSFYPQFVSSVKFRRALINASITSDELSHPITYAQYYEEIVKPGILSNIKKYTVGLPGVILNFAKGDERDTIIERDFETLISLTKNEIRHFDRLQNQLSVSPNEKEGVVSLTFTMPEPLIAAQMAQFAQELLQKEVIAYKISNAREQLRFTEERYEEKKQEFEEIQARLANFRDRNQNIASAAAQNQLQSLDAEFNFAFSIYMELAKQLEQARLQVAKDTPIFSVIQPVTIPSKKSAPKRPLILVIFMILGFIIGLGYVFGSEFLKGVKEQWNQV